jgi:hypothetical protein
MASRKRPKRKKKLSVTQKPKERATRTSEKWRRTQVLRIRRGNGVPVPHVVLLLLHE